MRNVKWTLTALFALLAAACIPEFASPLTGGDPADPALLGTWNAAPEGESDDMILEIAKAGGGIALKMRDPAGGEGDLSFKGTTAQIGGVRYANLSPLDQGVEAGYLVFRYELKDGTVRVQSLDGTKIAAAIDQGLLKGSVSGAGTDASAKITASSDELAAFFATPTGQAAFAGGPGDILILKKAAP